MAAGTDGSPVPALRKRSTRPVGREGLDVCKKPAGVSVKCVLKRALTQKT